MIPTHRHLDTSEEVIILRGEVEEILYNDSGEETERIHLLTGGDVVAVHVPKGCYHTCRSLRSGSVIMELHGCYVIRWVIGNSNKTYLVFKAQWPFRTTE